MRANELLARHVLNMNEKNDLLEQIRGKITVEEDADELIGTELTWKNLQKSMLLTEKMKGEYAWYFVRIGQESTVQDSKKIS